MNLSVTPIPHTDAASCSVLKDGDWLLTSHTDHPFWFTVSILMLVEWLGNLQLRLTHTFKTIIIVHDRLYSCIIFIPCSLIANGLCPRTTPGGLGTFGLNNLDIILVCFQPVWWSAQPNKCLQCTFLQITGVFKVNTSLCSVFNLL